MAVRYRDRITKRFVSESTWKRSKAHGGTRYVREAIKPRPPTPERRREKKIEEEEAAELPPPEFREPEEEEEEPEYTGAFDTP